jgi:uncharacterized membrane protein (UPF0136 family)
MQAPEIVLWSYIVLLVAGGLIGWLKAGSKISLIMSLLFALPLSLCALKVVQVSWLAEILLGALLTVFSVRLAKTMKFVPSGIMLVITAVALLLRLWLR